MALEEFVARDKFVKLSKHGGDATSAWLRILVVRIHARSCSSCFCHSNIFDAFNWVLYFSWE